MNITEKVLDQIIWGKRDFNANKAETTNEREAIKEKTKQKNRDFLF